MRLDRAEDDSRPHRHASALPNDLFAAVATEALGVRGHAGTYWLARGGAPHTVLGASIEQLARYVERPEIYAGVELWVRAKPASEGMAVHLDKDESLAKRTGELRHPSFASVLYLNCAGGETFVRIPQANGRDEVFLSAPEANAFLVFPGDLAHGVLAQDVGGDAMRASLLLNWWAQKPEAPNCNELPESVLCAPWSGVFRERA